MPQLFRFGNYVIYFWSNENNPLEPVHVHIAEKIPNEYATKVWLTKSGRAIVAHNKSNIPDNKLNKLLEIISDNFFLICSKWCEKFGKETLHFYC